MRSATLKRRLIKGLERQSKAVAAITLECAAEFLETLPVQANEKVGKKALISELKQIDRGLVEARTRIDRAVAVLREVTPKKGSTQQGSRRSKMSNLRSAYPRTGEIRDLLRQQKCFIPQPRDEKRYSYPSEIEPELMAPTRTEERRMLMIVRAINVNGKSNSESEAKNDRK